MKIEQSFPLECCEKCKSVRIYTNEQKLYSFDEVVEQVITIGCKYEQQCVAIYKMLKKQIMQKDDIKKAIDYLDWHFEADDGTADKDAQKAWYIIKNKLVE